jgi:Co/Zn/Cd efflux system component
VGYVVDVIKSPVATVLILAAAVFLLERSFRKEKEKDDDKLDEIRQEIEKLKQKANNKD